MHEPVLLEEILEGLKIKEGGKYIDATVGDGGHSLEILRRGGKVLGMDLDEGSLTRAKENFEKEGFSDFVLAQGNFAEIDNTAEANGFSEVNGVLFDLGYSSSQLEDVEIGLSFSKEQVLDMRLDKSLGVTAADLLAALPEGELERLFREYGEERSARRYAKAIVERRGVKRLETTKQLAELIVEAAPPGRDRLHPATRIFQALRIAVNRELENLELTLPRTARLLLPGGRMAIISFHSLEDRVVKNFGLGVQADLIAVNKKPITPSEEEISRNPRARSAKLRIFEKK